MENPCFQDIDQSMYESSAGIQYTTAAMPHHRRPHHLATLHHNHANNSVITHLHSPTGPVTTHSNTIHGHHASHGLPATAHIHGGRIVGVSGMPSVHSQASQGNRYEQNGMQALLSNSQPLYSCQAPRGHDHVYQCPGHRSDQGEHQHSNAIDIRNHIEQMGPHSMHHLDHCERVDHQRHKDSRDHVEYRSNQDSQVIGAEQRTEYHYGGSDYSSTEPIYAQPHLHPHEGQLSPTNTPPLAYTNIRGSLRTASHQHGTPARFLVRTDSTGESTSSSTLPTVSALLSVDRQRGRHTHEFTKNNSVSSSPSAPAKLKESGMFGVWRSKYLRGPGGNKKGTTILVLLVLLFIIFLAGISTVTYLTIGGKFGAIGGETPQLVHLTEKGSNIVTVEFRITNHNYWPELSDRHSEAFQTMSNTIEQKLDELFRNSIWSNEYNMSEVISLTPGSIVVRAQLHINVPDPLAANKLGSAFLRGLQEHHDQEWLGAFAIDIKSIRFAEILVDMASISSTTPISHPTQSDSQSDIQDVLRLPEEDVGWGEWSSWSSCTPCAPQYDQIRTRQCRLDGGQGILLSSIDMCIRKDQLHSRSSEGDMQTRACQCEYEKENLYDINKEPFLAKEEFSQFKVTTTTTTQNPQETTKEEQLLREESSSNGICERCVHGEVCVALVGEAFPTCRRAKEFADPTGCGGLCELDSEVCQALGQRAFQCHSASQCLDDEWRCADGLCIPQAKRCDGHLNCYDRSDEILCKCSNEEFHCGNRTSCLPMTVRCDGNVDCWDGLDEANCTEGDTAHLPSLVGATRPGTSVMNRTAIGLSSLSHRERELLS